MSLVRRGKYWWVDISLPDGKRQRASTGTDDRRKAQEYHDRLKAQYWDQRRLGAKPEYKWEQAVERYLSELVVDGLSASTIRNYKTHLEWWGTQYFAKKNLSEITKGKIMEGVYAIARQQSQSTANRYLSSIRSMLYRAEGKWEWLDKAPTKFEQFNEDKFARKRALSPEEISRVAQELPEHQREMFLFAVATGLRQANVKRLKWAWVNTQARVLRVPPNEFKNRTELLIPLNESALAVLRRQIGKHDEVVFTYRGEPVGEVNTRAWRRALQRAGVEDYRWHDNRHTWAHNLRKAGVALEDIQDLGGWKDAKMVRRYATPDIESLAAKSATIDAVLAPAHSRHTPDLKVVNGGGK